MIILVSIALFASHSRRGLARDTKGPSYRVKVPPAKGSEKGFGDENVRFLVSRPRGLKEVKRVMERE